MASLRKWSSVGLGVDTGTATKVKFLRSQCRHRNCFWLFRLITSSPAISGDQILHIPESNRGLLEPRMSVGGVLTVYLLYGLSWSYSYKVAARSVCSEDMPCLPLSQCEKMGMIIDQIQTNRTVLQSQHGLYNNSFPRSGIISEKIPAAFKGMRPKFVARQQQQQQQRERKQQTSHSHRVQ